MTHQEYTDIFRQAASRHKLIAHTQERTAFARIILSSDPYLDSYQQIGEFLKGKERVLRDPFMLVTNYEAGYRNQKGDDIKKMLSGRMIILTQVKPDDHQGEEDALEMTEQIGEQCLSWIENYSEIDIRVPQLFFDWNGVETDRISGLTGRNLFGTAFNFVFQASARNTFYDPTNYIS